MVKTKEKDFVEIDYIGKIKESNQIFDLTDKELAKKEGIFNEKSKYGSKIICIGEKQILPAIDRFLVDKEVGQSYSLELKPEESFGKKDPNLVKVIPSEILIKQRIRPFPGLQIHAGGLIGTIRSVTGGRVSIDYNHLLAGKNLVYDIKINRVIEKDEEKVRSLVENMLNLSSKEYTFNLEGKKFNVKLGVIIPILAKKEVKDRVNSLVPSLELEFN